jgi:hypothetical protein
MTFRFTKYDNNLVGNSYATANEGNQHGIEGFFRLNFRVSFLNRPAVPRGKAENRTFSH